MPAILPRASCYSTDCDDPITTLVPGTPGLDGADGADGADGQNAYTTLTGEFTMPAAGGTITANVVSNTWMAYGQIIAIGDPAGMVYGYLQVGAKTGSTQVALTNLEDGTGIYLSNSAPGTVFPIGTIVSPGGLQGPAGVAGAEGGGATADATYWVSSPDPDLSAEVDMSALAAGYLKVNAGTPSSVTTLPIADLATGPAATTTVLKPDGVGGVEMGQVEDNEIAYGKTTIAAAEIDWSADRVFFKQLAANTVFDHTNTVDGKQILVVLQQGNGTAYTATFTATGLPGDPFRWSAGIVATMTVVSEAYLVLAFLRTGNVIQVTYLNDMTPAGGGGGGSGASGFLAPDTVDPNGVKIGAVPGVMYTQLEADGVTKRRDWTYTGPGGTTGLWV